MKILLAEQEHTSIQKGVYGGDKAMNDQIALIIRDGGNTVFRKAYPPFDVLLLLRRFTYGLFTRLDDEFDFIICDSNISIYFNHKKTINIFHYSFFGYENLVGKYCFNFIDKTIYKLYSWLQYIGSVNKYNIAVSSFMKNILQQQGIAVSEVVNNSCDTSIFKNYSFKKGSVDLVYAGGYSYFGKGFDVLESIASKGYHIDCYTNHKKKYINIIFRKMVPRIKIPEILNKYKILLYPSRFESFGMVPLEAMACGIPVIMGDVGLGYDLKKEIPEFVVDINKNGYVDKYIENIEIILNNYKKYSDMARNFVKKKYGLNDYEIAWKKLIKKYENHI